MSRPKQGPYVGGLLRLAWLSVRERMLQDVRASGFPDLTQAQLNLFRYPGLEGRRPSELADDVSISKQSVNDLLRELENAGYVSLEIDRTDRRARIIRLTRTGRRLEAAIWDAAEGAERWLEGSIGKARVRELRRTLGVLTAAIPDRDQ